ncbi:MAG: aspartate/glutamate racemase family protein [Pseudomonadota bacterium]
MRVLVVNPNSTASMTDGIVEAARSAAASDLEIVGMTNASAPPAIQGEADGHAATPGVIYAVREAEANGFDAAIVACFDDTGLAAAKAAVKIPVIGIGQAAFLSAMVYGHFSVITTLPVSVPVIEANLRGYGLTGVCRAVHASGLPVLSLEDAPDRASTVLYAAAAQVAKADAVDAIVLGCAGMASFAPAMQQASGLPAVDGVAAAVGLVRTVAYATG